MRELRKTPTVDNSCINTKKQHDILMDEFRKVHHKMFASANSEANSSEEKKTESPSNTKPIEQTVRFKRFSHLINYFNVSIYLHYRLKYLITTFNYLTAGKTTVHDIPFVHCHKL